MFKRFIVQVLMFVNLGEGLIHIVVSGISFWGIYDMGVSDWRIMTAPTCDLILGGASLITSYFLKDLVNHGCLAHKNNN